MRTLAVLLLLGASVAWPQNGAPSISPNTVPVADAQSEYSVTFTIFVGQLQITWSISSGALPNGLGLDPNSGTISGAPAAAGSYPFTVTAKDQRGGTIASKSYNLTVLPPLMITTPSPLPPGIVNQDYRPVSLQASGGALPYVYAVQSSFGQNQNLPPGMQLSPSGQLSGMPASTGTYMFNLMITDCAVRDSDGLCAGYSALFPYSITIVNPLSFTNASPLPGGSTNNFYTQTLAATGGQSPYTFEIKDPQDLPPGLMLDSKSGVLSGTPTMTGSFNFNVQVTDSFKFAVSKVFALTIAAGVSPIQVLPTGLDFTAAVGGDRPEPQSLAVTSTSAKAVGFNVQVDGGQPNTPSPFSLTVNLLSGTTPAGLQVSVAQVDQNNSPLAPGKYSARILVSGNAIPVNLTVATVAGSIGVAAGAAAADSAAGVAAGVSSFLLQAASASSAHSAAVIAKPLLLFIFMMSPFL